MRKASIESENFENFIDDAVIKRESLRPVQHMSFVSPLEISENLKKPGYEYAWVNYVVQGQQTFAVEMKMRDGWEVVPVSRAKEYATDFLERNPVGRKYITYKDVVLMERPIEMGEKDRKMLADLNSRQMRGLRGVSDGIYGGDVSPHVMNRNY